jgi:quercetin dioxygenase-like cupin family protein
MIVKLETAPKVPFMIEGRILFADEHAELIHLTLKRGEVLEKHDNPFDVIFYVLAGKAKLKLENEVFILDANDCISVSTGIQRAMENLGEANLKILVYKIKK